MSASTPVLPPAELASSPRAMIKAGYESDTHAAPQSFGALIKLRETRKRPLIYRPSKRTIMSPLSEGTPKTCRLDNRVSFLRKYRGKRAA